MRQSSSEIALVPADARHLVPQPMNLGGCYSAACSGVALVAASSPLTEKPVGLLGALPIVVLPPSPSFRLKTPLPSKHPPLREAFTPWHRAGAPLSPRSVPSSLHSWPLAVAPPSEGTEAADASATLAPPYTPPRLAQVHSFPDLLTGHHYRARRPVPKLGAHVRELQRTYGDATRSADLAIAIAPGHLDPAGAQRVQELTCMLQPSRYGLCSGATSSAGTGAGTRGARLVYD